MYKRQVTQIDSADGKDKITLISSKAFKESLTDIKVVNANTLINTKTQTTALLLKEQGYALVGNKVIVADDLLIEDKNGDVYYNLEVICSLLSNAELKSINLSLIHICKSLTQLISEFPYSDLIDYCDGGKENYRMFIQNLGNYLHASILKKYARAAEKDINAIVNLCMEV